jgi:hypothetical protein
VSSGLCRTSYVDGRETVGSRLSLARAPSHQSQLFRDARFAHQHLCSALGQGITYPVAKICTVVSLATPDFLGERFVGIGFRL